MKVRCIIDHDHHWLKNGEIYYVNDYHKDMDCYIVKNKNGDCAIYNKCLFEIVDVLNEKHENIYALSWLETAFKNCKKQNNEVSAIQGDITMSEFIEKWCKEELRKAVKVE